MTPIVNAHGHSAMIAFRGKGRGLPLDRWLNEVIWPLEAKEVNPDFVYRETINAIKEMQECGTSAFMDMYFFEDSVAKAAQEMNMPVVIGEGLIDIKGDDIFRKDLDKTLELIEKYKGNSLVKVSVAPHSPYTVKDNNLLKAKKIAKENNCIYQIHTSETKKEFDDSIKKYGLTPVEYLNSLGVLDSKTVLIHCVHLTDKDISIIKENDCKVVHCPESNIMLKSGVAPVYRMLKEGITVALGTDGGASCDRLDIVRAGKLAQELHKSKYNDGTEITDEDVGKMMNINGLKTLGMENCL